MTHATRPVVRLALVAAAAVAITPLVLAQQTVPFRNNIPVAPSGIPSMPLPTAPVTFETAEGQTIRVVVVARGLSHPWSLAFLPGGDMLVTERGGRLRIIRNGALDPAPVAGVPAVQAQGLSGLMDVVLHPRFADNRYVYLSYTKPVGPQKSALALARGRWDGKALTAVQDIYAAEGAGGGARLAFDRDGLLYMTTGGGGDMGAQDPNNLGGKVLRLTDDGTPAPGNPLAGKGGKPEVFTLGHRNSMGLALHPGTGEMWQHENGPNGGDKIDILHPGSNYGWPLSSYGRTYPGPRQSEMPWLPRFEQPVVFWVPSIAVSGMAFYTGNKLAKWKGDLFVGSMRVGEIPGTGHLERILFNDKMEELRRESLLVPMRQRIRDVRQGPDELLYVLTDETDGAVLRIEPAS